MRISIVFFIGAFILSCNDNSTPAEPATGIENTIMINYSLVNSFPHDITSFTEGFLVHNGKIYESTGYTAELPQTRSLFGEVDMETGKINAKAELDKTKYFGEGITFLHDKVYQLTYKTKIGFIYDTATFKKTGDFSFSNDEGWGMTTDSSSLIMSDGTSDLTYLNPITLKPVKQLKVIDGSEPVDDLNELEFIKGFIYANIYETNLIVKIDPNSGLVVGKLDLTALAKEQKNKFNGSLQMNGIAYDPVKDKIFITGKMWPNIYEISFPH